MSQNDKLNWKPLLKTYLNLRGKKKEMTAKDEALKNLEAKVVSRMYLDEHPVETTKGL